MVYLLSFRPLDGESISKLSFSILQEHYQQPCFRPLDGESISKLSISDVY